MRRELHCYAGACQQRGTPASTRLPGASDWAAKAAHLLHCGEETRGYLLAVASRLRGFSVRVQEEADSVSRVILAGETTPIKHELMEQAHL